MANQTNTNNTVSTNNTTTNTMNNTNTIAMNTTKLNAIKTFASKGIEADFNTGTLNGRTIRQFAIIRTTKVEEGKTVIAGETLVNRNQLIVLLSKKLAGKTAKAAQGLIFKSLEQALFVEKVGYGNPASLTELATRDHVANAFRAYVLHDNGDAISAVKLDGNTVARLVAQTKLAVCPDKQVSKAVLVGPGANAAGVYRINGKLVGINPLKDFNKGPNRASLNFAPKANSDERITGNIEFETDELNFTAEGIQRRVAFFPGLVVLAQGMIAVNESASFDYYASFHKVVSISVDSVGAEINEISEVSILSNGTEITVNGVVVYTHNSYTVIDVHSIRPELSEDGKVWNIVIDGDLIALSKFNVKARGFGIKGMTHRNGVTIAEDNDWDMLLSSECVKTAETLRTMYTQAHGAHMVDVDGVLRDVNGNEVTSRDIRRWYSTTGKFYTVHTPIHFTNIDEVKKAGGDVTFSAPDADGIVIATQKVFGIIADTLFDIELSSADEIAGWTAMDATATTVQSLISSRYEEALQRVAVKQARKVAIVRHNGNYKNFDNAAKELPLAGAAVRFAALRAEHGNVKAALSAIVSAGIDSFKVACPVLGGFLTVPAKAFLAFGQFDAVGNPAVSLSDANPVQLVADFLALAATTTDDKALRDALVATGVVSEVSKFVQLQLNKITADVMTTNKSFYAKAIADWRVPAFVSCGHGNMVPVVYVAPESPVFMEGRNQMANNEFVVLTRCPMPAAVVAQVRVAPFAMDANVVCVNPLIMDVNHGDCDGDAVSITAPGRLGVAITGAEAMAFNKSVVSIGGYRESLAKAGELSTTVNAMAEVAELPTNNSRRKKFNNKFTNIMSEVEVDVWAVKMGLIHEVYANHVSSAYDIAFNALQQFSVRKACGESVNNLLVEAMEAYTIYEDKALCGYSKETYDFMVNYLEGVNTSRFSTAVTESIITFKSDFKDGEVTTTPVATAALATRIAAKRFKSGYEKKAVARVAYLAKAAAKIPASAAVIKAIAEAAVKALV